MKHTIIVIALMSCCFFYVQAEPVMKVYTTADGLAGNSVGSIAIDRGSSTIWIDSSSYLQFYSDGAWHTYPGVRCSFSPMVCDYYGKLWLTCDGYLFSVTRSSLTNHGVFGNSYMPGRGIDIACDQINRLWIAVGHNLEFEGGGIVSYDAYHSCEFTRYPMNTYVAGRLSPFCLTVDEQDTVWTINGYGIKKLTSSGYVDLDDNYYYAHVIGANFPYMWLGRGRSISSRDYEPHFPDSINAYDNFVDGVMCISDTGFVEYNTLNSNIPTNFGITCFAFSRNGDVWVGTVRNGISIFDGVSWDSLTTSNSALISNRIIDIEFEADGDAWISTGYGLAYYGEDPPVIIETDEAVPVEVLLSAPYPNPFNPATTINYTLTEHGHATITIYNAAGQVVDVLVNGDASAGSHTVVWDAAGHASGLYFARLEAGGMSATQKLLLMK